MDRNTNFVKLDCITRTCGNNCSIFDKETLDNNKKVAYTVFESVETLYYNKQCEQVS